VKGVRWAWTKWDWFRCIKRVSMCKGSDVESLALYNIRVRG